MCKPLLKITSAILRCLSKMKTLILAGGKGTRLRPYTTVIPKPLMPVGEQPILEILLRQLRSAGVLEVILAVGYMHHLFEAFFQEGARYGLKIHYSVEEKPLGTAGAIALVLDQLGEDFLVMNGDLLTTLDFRNLYLTHKNTRAAATISVCPREVKMDYGVIEMGAEQSLSRYIEKPVYNFQVSMGINVLNAKAVRPYLVAGQSLDIPELMTRLRQDGKYVKCYCENCHWLDIGRLDDYERATEIFSNHPTQFLAAA